MWVVYTPADTVMCPAQIYYIGDARGALKAAKDINAYEKTHGWEQSKLHAVKVDCGVNLLDLKGPMLLSGDHGLESLAAAAQAGEDRERTLGEIGAQIAAAKSAVLQATTFDALQDAEAEYVRLNELYTKIEAQ